MAANDKTNDAPGSAATFTIMIAIGPDSVELGRLRDVIESVIHYEPSVSRLIVIDDAPGTRDIAASLLALPKTCRVEIVKSPRQGRGEPRMGGLTAVMLAGIRAASRGEIGDFLLKLDTDALVIAPFAEKLRDVLRHEPAAGIIGACKFSPTGKPRGEEHHRRVFINAATWSLSGPERKTVGRHRSFPSTWTQWKLFRVARRARKSGCTMGENVMGGAYAIAPKAVRRMNKAGLLNDLMLWVDTFASEDGVMGLYAAMLGLKLVDNVERGDVFGIVYRGLLALPEDLVAGNYSIIHSLKNDERISESDIRTFFAARRTGESITL